MANLLHRNDRVVTVHNKCSKNHTIDLNALCNSCAKIMCCSFELVFAFLYAGGRIQIVSEQFVLFLHLSFVNFSLHATLQTKF